MTTLYVLDGPDRGLTFNLEADTTFIGRTRGNHIHLKDPYISRRHLQLLHIGNKYFVKDLHSKNGTSVDGEALNPGQNHEIQEGSTIVLGMSVICLGEKCAERIRAFLEAIHVSSVSNAAGGTETVILKAGRKPPQTQRTTPSPISSQRNRFFEPN
ncbi:MAG: FHA domain-containing protein [Thermodesulfobacteriota bacterium]